MKFITKNSLLIVLLAIFSAFKIGANNSGYKVYSTASGNKLQIELENHSMNNSDIDIYDGEMHSLESYHIEGKQNKLTINSEDWPSGIYFIIISQRITQQTILQKININHLSD